MAATINYINTRVQLKAAEIDATVKNDRADSAYQLIEQYNFMGVTGSMPGFSWTAPTGLNFEYAPGAGELYYSGVQYSTLNPTKKREFFLWLDKFVKRCIFNYNETYNL